MALTDKLTAIGAAIREKTGKSELLTLDAMPTEIASITTGGGGGSGDCNGIHIPEEGLLVTGNCQFRFAYNGWNWYIETAGNKITTTDISGMSDMFYNSDTLTEIPFDINSNSSGFSMSRMFASCKRLKTLPKITGAPVSMERFCDGCSDLRYVPEDMGDWIDWSWMDSQTSTSSTNRANMFRYCYSLRSVPMEFLNHSGVNIKYNYSIYYSLFNDCFTLDEVVGLPIPYTATWTRNAFNNTFINCHRLKNLTFATQEDGTPIVVNWSNQTIDLSSVGWATASYKITDYNSGITADKEVTDDASYAALKDDPNWWTLDVRYSRYNHDSAVATINSLPDASSSGGTNTIKFKGIAGELTDGGAINTLTEVEIAVATAKGWTVSLV